MFFVLEIEAVAVTGVVEWCRAIDEKHGVLNVVFLLEFSEERMSDHVRSGRFMLYM